MLDKLAAIENLIGAGAKHGRSAEEEDFEDRGLPVDTEEQLATLEQQLQAKTTRAKLFCTLTVLNKSSTTVAKVAKWKWENCRLKLGPLSVDFGVRRIQCTRDCGLHNLSNNGYFVAIPKRHHPEKK